MLVAFYFEESNITTLDYLKRKKQIMINSVLLHYKGGKKKGKSTLSFCVTTYMLTLLVRISHYTSVSLYQTEVLVLSSSVRSRIVCRIQIFV